MWVATAVTVGRLASKVSGLDPPASRHVTSSMLAWGIAARVLFIAVGIPPGVYRWLLAPFRGETPRQDEVARDPLREVQRLVTGADIFGHLVVQAPSAWSVCLDAWI